VPNAVCKFGIQDLSISIFAKRAPTIARLLAGTYLEKDRILQNEGGQQLSFEDVARKITGGDAPQWLTKFLRDWASSLALDRGVAFRQPTKSQMKERLQGVQNAAKLIVDALNDGATRDFLDASTTGKLPYHGQIDHMLRDLIRRSGEGVALLSTSDGKTRRGREKALPPDSFLPKTFCAAIIAEAWNFINGAEPAPKNQQAATAADFFWDLSFGVVRMDVTEAALQRIVNREPKSWGNRLNSWRSHFEQAKEPAVSNIRQEIRRHLVEGKHRAEMQGGAEVG
jgi:hypothetical protein